uniref:MAK10-like protein n=1 Tax=Tanacetum cinerariifolium TaxID=118510 RepID=A0A699H965_TANCI|nr:MAK10-like protein [Tanacetum cinerariifolium]
MGDMNHIRTLGDYSKPSHEGYRNTIELHVGNNVVPLRSDTIRLVQNGCSFHELRFEDPNQHLKDFLELGDSLDLDEDLALYDNESWNDLRDFVKPVKAISLPQDVSSKSYRRLIELENQVQRLTEAHLAPTQPTKVNPITRRTINQSVSDKLHDKIAKESWALLEDLALYDNESWNDLRDFAKSMKAISLPQDVLSKSYRRLIELENQVQRLTEAHLAPTQPTKVNKITTSCEICSGPYNTQHYMEDPEQAFVEYTSFRTDEARGKRYTFKPEQNNLCDTYNPSWKNHPNFRWRQPQNSQNNFSNPPNWFQLNDSILNHPFNNNLSSFNNQLNPKGLVCNFMASQDARLSKFEADFKQQQSKMTNQIDIALKAIIDRMAGALPNDMVKNSKLNVNTTTSVLSACPYPTVDL